MNTKLVASLVVLAIGCLGASMSWAQAGAHIMVTPNDRKWADVPSLPPGAKITVIEGPMTEAVPFTVRIKLPADYKVPAHWHPAAERVTVLSGTFNIGMRDKLDPQKTTALGPGSVIHAAPDQPFCVDQRGNHGAGPRDRSVGHHLH
jgi:hypothetical protein